MSTIDIFHPSDISGERQVRAYTNEAWDYLRSLEKFRQQNPIGHHINAIELALATVVRGNRGVGAVIVHQQEGVVGKGENTVQEPGNEWMHVAHAEINAIHDMNRGYADRIQQIVPHTELISSIGPCAMCMAGTINRKIPLVTTLSPDYTGGITLEGMAQAFTGWKRHIDEEHIRYRTADSSHYPTNVPEGTAGKLATLAWALSRITKMEFNRAEFERGLDGSQAMGNGK